MHLIKSNNNGMIRPKDLRDMPLFKHVTGGLTDISRGAYEMNRIGHLLKCHGETVYEVIYETVVADSDRPTCFGDDPCLDECGGCDLWFNCNKRAKENRDNKYVV